MSNKSYLTLMAGTINYTQIQLLRKLRTYLLLLMVKYLVSTGQVVSKPHSLNSTDMANDGFSFHSWLM